MNELLKQRLVGALILLALGVIFWPIIFVQPGDREIAAQQDIPAPPVVSSDPVAEPDSTGLRASPSPSPRREEPAAEREADPEPPPAQVDTEVPEKLAMDEDGLPVAWILQVASVSSADKADALRRRLLDLGHKAYVTEVRRDDKTLYRVYVGPKLERASLEALRPGIDSEFGVQSMLVRYVP